MARRYGRNQKRAHRAEIEALREKLYGVWGEPPAHLTRIDHLSHVSFDTRKSETNRSIEEEVSITYRVLSDADFKVLSDAHRNSTILVHGDMCLYPVEVALNHDTMGIDFDGRSCRDSLIVEHEIEATFKRVRAPQLLW